MPVGGDQWGKEKVKPLRPRETKEGGPARWSRAAAKPTQPSTVLGLHFLRRRADPEPLRRNSRPEAVKVTRRSSIG
jgi:hypothetical protein